jgi:tetratricopeptide (TPR) repeat protein
VAQSLQGQAVQALGLLRGVESWLERHGSAAQRQHYWGTVGHVLRLLQRHRECAEAMARSLGLAEGLGDHAEVMVVSSNLAALYSYLGRRDYAREAAQRAWRQRDRLGEADGVAAAQVDLHMATYACMPEGRYADALDFAEAARRKLARPGAEIWAVHADNHLANLWLQIGQSARAAQVLAGAEHGASPGIRARRLHLRARLQQQLEHSGQVLLRQALELIGPTGEAPTRLPIELDLARELQSEQALALVQRVMDEAQRIEMHGVVATAAAERADTLRRAGRVDEGAKVAADALRTLAVCHPFDGYVPECLWLAARALLAAGQRAAARAALKQAAHWVAAAQVPEAFRHAFGERHRVNSGIATELMRLANSA